MRFSALFFAAAAATTVLARSSYEVRSPYAIEDTYSELEARGDIDDAEIISHFLRSLDEDELDYVYRRGMKASLKKVGHKVGNMGSKAKGLVKGVASRMGIKQKNQVKPVDKQTKKEISKSRPTRKLKKTRK